MRRKFVEVRILFSRRTFLLPIVQRELAKFEKLISNVQTDEVALDEKIAKRLEEKDRHQRRLDMLKSVR